MKMVFGDAVIAISNAVANNGFLSYQPAAGVEAEIRQAGGGDGGPNDFQAGIYDGTNYAIINWRAGAPTNANFSFNALNLLITNGVYFGVKNVSGFALDLAYSAVQTK